MRQLSEQAAADFGERLRQNGFRPLPEVDDGGQLVGTRLWRVHAGYVEYLTLQHQGRTHAVRAVAEFDYRRPFEHGQVVDDHFGVAIHTLDWLLHGWGPQ